jgi:putative transposase
MLDRESAIGVRRRKHVVRFDPRDLSRIYVFDEARGEYLEIGYRRRSHPPITLKESEAARQKLAALKKDVANERLLFDTVSRMRTEIAAEAAKTKSARRAKARREEALAGAERDRSLRPKAKHGTATAQDASSPANLAPTEKQHGQRVVVERFDDIDEAL